MKKAIILGAFLLSASLLDAQNSNNTATVRIKKVENINGVETITDTTFTTDNPSSIHLENGTIDISETGLDSIAGKILKTVIVHDGNGENMTIDVQGMGEELSKEIENALKEAGVDDSKGGKNIVIIKNEDKGEGSKAETTTKKIIVTQHIEITNANEGEIQKVKKATGETDGKLNIEKMNLYPNPSSGKFNLTFNLPGKGETEIAILNSEGKVVYKEKLGNFTGKYEKEIDISNNSKGMYLIRVVQNGHAQVKKIVLE